MSVISSLAARSDGGLFVLGVSLCLAAALCVFRLRSRMRQMDGMVQASWIFLAGLEAGVGVWATQLLLLISYRPDVATGYDALIALSGVLVSVLGAILAFAIGWGGRDRTRLLAGSMVFSMMLGIDEYIAFKAASMAAVVHWEPVVIWCAMVVNMVTAHAALTVAGRARSFPRQLAGAGLVTFAVVAAHYLCLASMTVIPDIDVVLGANLIEPTSLMLVVIMLAAMIIIGGMGAAYIDDAQSAVTVRRLRRLADSAREGIVVVQRGQINDTNAFFCALVGASPAELLKRDLFDGLLRLEPVSMDGSDRRDGWVQPLDPQAAEIPVEIYLQDEQQARSSPDHVIITMRDMREQRAAERRIHFLAEHDGLTGLQNRKAMHVRLTEAVARARRTREKLAIICVNLDGFKSINDLHGQEAGDAMLAAYAHRLSRAVKAPSFVARHGGDEFVLVLFMAETESAIGLEAWTQGLVQDLRSPISFRTGPVEASACIGISLFPDNGNDADTLLINADTALQRAKSNGRMNVCFFEYETDNTVRERRDMARDLRRAIVNRELVVFYQPQARADCAELCGFEALVRWQHPEKGMIPADVFIPIAEEQGLIIELGEWVLQQACTEAATWPSRISVAVNLSPYQLTQTDLADRVRQTLFETGLPASRLELEVTESALFKNYQGALDTLRRIKAMGVGVAMDDFGTGFSSLSTLQSFPFDKIKIDKSFVQGIGQFDRSTVIVRAVLGIGRGLGIPVVAEGVETQAQLDFLKQEDCAAIQGYLLGRPAPLEDHRALFNAVTWGTAPAIHTLAPLTNLLDRAVS